MNAMIDSREGFSGQEEMAYHEAAEVREFDFAPFIGVACSVFGRDSKGDDGKQVYHWKNADSLSNAKCIVIDRRKLGSKSSRRFQVIRPNHNQDVIGLCRSLKEVQKLIFRSGKVY